MRRGMEGLVGEVDMLTMAEALELATRGPFDYQLLFQRSSRYDEVIAAAVNANWLTLWTKPYGFMNAPHHDLLAAVSRQWPNRRGESPSLFEVVRPSGAVVSTRGCITNIALCCKVAQAEGVTWERGPPRA